MQIKGTGWIIAPASKNLPLLLSAALCRDDGCRHRTLPYSSDRHHGNLSSGTNSSLFCVYFAFFFILYIFLSILIYFFPFLCVLLHKRSTTSFITKPSTLGVCQGMGQGVVGKSMFMFVCLLEMANAASIFLDVLFWLHTQRPLPTPPTLFVRNVKCMAVKQRSFTLSGAGVLWK
jgi:hypothetical protein